MILEVAILNIRAGQEKAFEKSFNEAQNIISSMNGYISHELQHCIEQDSRYILLVRWETLQDHTDGFRNSPEYQQWKAMLHHYYDPFPRVEHYQQVLEWNNSNNGR